MHTKSADQLTQNFLKNIEWLRSSLPSLFDFIELHRAECLERLTISENDDDFSIYDGKQLLYQNLLAELESQYKQLLVPSKVDRIGCRPYPDIQSSDTLTPNSYNHDYLINNVYSIKLDAISELLPINSHDSILSNTNTFDHSRRSICTLGILGLLPFAKNISEYDCQIFCDSSLTFVESDPFFFFVLIHLLDFESLVTLFRSKRVGLNIVCESNAELLKLNLIDLFITKNIYYMFSTTILRIGSIAPELMEIFSWLHAEDGIRQYLYACLGNTSDEFNHCINTTWNLSSLSVYSTLSDLHVSEECLVTLIASGPSASISIQEIQNNRNGQIIVACGSALGVVAESGLHPDFVVLLERGPSVYDDVKLLFDKYPSLSRSTLLAATSVDPRLSNLFSRTIYFFRQASAVSKLYNPIASDSLLICGPNVVNAAFEAFAQCGARSFMLVGCDFAGSASGRRLRAESATGGRYKRNLRIPIQGACGKTVFSDSRLIVSRDIIQKTIDSYSDLKIYRIGDGAMIKHVEQCDISLISSIYSRYSLSGPTFSINASDTSIYTRINDLNSFDSIDLSEVWEAKIKAIVKSPSLSLSELRSLNTYLSRYSMDNLPSVEAFARDLLAQPLFTCLIKYLDGNRSSQSFHETLSLLSTILSDVVKYIKCAERLSSSGKSFDSNLLLSSYSTLFHKL